MLSPCHFRHPHQACNCPHVWPSSLQTPQAQGELYSLFLGIKLSAWPRGATQSMSKCLNRVGKVMKSHGSSHDFATNSCIVQASLVAQWVKNLPASAGDTEDLCSIPELGRSPGGENGNPLQYSCLGNPMDKEA